MIVTYGKHKYSCVPHSHVIFHVCAFEILFFAYESSCMPFFLNFFINALLSIVSFCLRDVFNFQLTDGEELWQIGTYMD